MGGLYLAGELEELGDAWLAMFGNWSAKGLQVGLGCLVVIIMIQKFSLKAGIGALLLMVIALGLYNSRNDLADMFEDEVKNPATGAPAVPGNVRSFDPAVVRDRSLGAGGGR
ncbi:hypothetical protein EJ357_46685 [Streptomyces cyaneochromogenes]|uniref:Uncharacterized protein n=1 Tax=Streptomyces cyaneochromogenes TaxID=2496836 RepID=A0A3S9ML98_9ACTN|nr:hypothetical protein [Streptomyces cyaneochromogenes]AZQ39975.1 hypothetical protein EJ357_46685 [Streptomyces cyaneochromogenes]